MKLSGEVRKAALILGPAGRWALDSGFKYATWRCPEAAAQRRGGCLPPRASEKAVLEIPPIKNENVTAGPEQVQKPLRKGLTREGKECLATAEFSSVLF